MENQRPIAKTAVKGMSIIVPVYNESGSILSTIQELEEVMSSEKQELEYNIIIVNDGSTDETESKLTNNSFTDTKIISHLSNLGYGAALKTGIRNAQHECVVITDADGNLS